MKKKLRICILIFGGLLIYSINFSNSYCSDNSSDPSCVEEINGYNSRVKKYNDATSKKDYIQALYALEQLKKYNKSGVQEINNDILRLCEYLGGVYFDKAEYSESIKYYKKALEIYENPETLFLVGYAYFYMENYDVALTYFRQAKQKSLDSGLDTAIDEMIELTELGKEYTSAKKNWKTNDELGYFQYYLSGINIFDARDKLPNKKHNVVVAIIDDGVNINHPDLTENIWVNKKEKDGDGIDNDNNGYIDDYNGWDFVQNEEYKIPAGSHGTMVAGIMAASTNNSIGIAGIVPEIEIMPLKVIEYDGRADEENVINAINYAIENGANIINLSLTKDQFNYNNKFDSIFKKANRKGIVVVVAAGNGDKLSLETEGVNTTINRISPICNESDKKTIIGVGALDKKGFQLKRSNYGDCVDLYIYGENIYSTAITYTEVPYAVGSGTSFSSPIIAGIIGLGYNKYGQISPNIVYDNLKKSLNGNIIDAAKYLDNLSSSFGELKNAIRFLSNKGFTQANNPDDFKLNKDIRKDEAAKFFVMYANLFNKNTIINSDDICKFSDLGDASINLRSYIINACRYGLLTGNNGKFEPGNKLTNAQVINIFMKIYGSNYSSKYFIEMNKNGLLDGMIMGKEKNSGRNATRGEIALLLYRGLKIMNQK